MSRVCEVAGENIVIHKKIIRTLNKVLFGIRVVGFFLPKYLPMYASMILLIISTNILAATETALTRTPAVDLSQRKSSVKPDGTSPETGAKTKAVLTTPANHQVDGVEPMHVTVIGNKTHRDERHAYEIDLLHLILDKTIEEFGPYVSVPAPTMGHLRGLMSLSQNTYPNFVRTFGYQDSLVEDRPLTPIYYPVYRGLLGYRTCFLSKKIQSQFAQVKTRAELIRYTHGYGNGWGDIDIMRLGGIPVVSVSSYAGLFRMAAENRVDLFCRGSNEVFTEYQNNSDIPNLAYDKSKAFYYSFPHFFFTHESNKKLIARLTRGFQIALDDGSLIKLWHQHFDESLHFIQLEKRQIFYFNNPFIKNLSNDYMNYVYWPKNFDKSQVLQSAQ
ncbi:hypothetical protein TDB9533_04005 [Thalassocella blandensis]|nr:hypothetical protein TDB9533_04005 [Thalassocella blandensis]